MGGSDYDVFISYARSVSTPLAVDLQRELERFAKKWNQMRALRVFRDDSSMSASPSLWSSIEAALTTSNYFILIATPDSAASEYVDQEARWWVTHKGADSILLVLAGGKLDWSDAAGGFTPDSVVPPALHRAFAEEPRWIDMTWFDGPDSAGNGDPRFQERVADLAAPVRGVDRDALIGTNLKEHRKTMRRARIAIAALATLLVAALVAGGVAVTQRNTAKKLFADAVGQRIASESTQMLAGKIQGGVGRGLQELLVAEQLKTVPDPGAYLDGAVAVARIEKILTGDFLHFLVLSPTADLIATDTPAHRGDIQIWDANLGTTGPPIQTGNNSYPLAFSNDGSLLAVGNEEGVVELWDLKSRTREAARITPTARKKSSGVKQAVFTPDDKGLVVLTLDNTIRFYSVETMVQTAAEIPNSAWFASPRAGQIVAVAALDENVVEIRDPWAGSLIGKSLTVPSPLSSEDCRSFDAVGNRLLINAEIFDMKTRASLGKVRGGSGTGNCTHAAALSPDGGIVLEGGDTIHVASTDTEVAEVASTEPEIPINLLSRGGPFSVAWLDERHIVAQTQNGMLRLVVDLPKLASTSKVDFGATEDEIVAQQGRDVWVYRHDNAMSIRGKILLGARGDSIFTTDPKTWMWEEWSFRDGSRKRNWPLLFDGDTIVRSAESTRDERSIVVLTGLGMDVGGGTLRRWDMATGQQIGNALRVPANIDIVDLVAYDGGQVTAFTRDPRVLDSPGATWVFDLDNGTSNDQHEFSEPVAAVAMCRDSAGLATWIIAEQSGRIGFAKGPLNEPIQWSHPPTLVHGSGDKKSAELLGDDCRTGASWDSEGLNAVLRFWDVEGGVPLGSPVLGGKVIGGSADGRVVALTERELSAFTIAGFRLIPERPSAADLCAKLVFNMSRKQWNEWVSPDIPYQKACPDLPIQADD